MFFLTVLWKNMKCSISRPGHFLLPWSNNEQIFLALQRSSWRFSKLFVNEDWGMTGRQKSQPISNSFTQNLICLTPSTIFPLHPTTALILCTVFKLHIAPAGVGLRNIRLQPVRMGIVSLRPPILQSWGRSLLWGCYLHQEKTPHWCQCGFSSQLQVPSEEWF